MRIQPLLFTRIKKFLGGQDRPAAGPDGRPFRLVLAFYSPDGTSYSMPVACLSAMAKREFPGIEVHLVEVNLTLPNGADHSVDGFVRRVSVLQPDLIGISCMSLHWFPLDPYLRALKNALPQLPVLVGGYQAALAPEETIEHPAVDFICIGDGEYPLTGLIHRLIRRSDDIIPGLWEKRPNGHITKTEAVLSEDLSLLPFPDYTIFEQHGRLTNLRLSMLGIRDDQFILPVMTGRGCPHHCTYCSNTTLLETYRGKGSYLRKYDPEALVDELCRLRDRYNVRYFEFWDELFLFNIKYVREFLGIYKARVGLPFSITSRVEKMDEEFCNFVADAGCHAVWFGIESGSESYRHKYLNRMMTNEQIIWAAENARKAGIRRLTFNIVGLPFESADDLRGTLEINRIIRPDVFQFFPFMPLRGTELYQLAEREGLLFEENDSDFGSSNRAGYYRTNLKPHPGTPDPDTFNAICQEMQALQAELNDVNQFYEIERPAA